MPRRAHEDHLVGEERLEADATMTPGGADDPQLELAGRNTLDDGMRVRDREKDPHQRVLTLELAENDGNDDCRRSRRCPQHEVSCEIALARGAHVGDELILEREHPLSAAVEPPSRLGRLDASTRAVEELRAQALLQRSHLQ
jgi:hypothetical protein